MLRLLDRNWGWALAAVAVAAAVGIGASLASALSPPRVDSSRWDEGFLARPAAAGVLGRYCVPDGLLPDPRCTSGITDPLVSDAAVESTVCWPGWAAARQSRLLPPDKAVQVKTQVAKAYSVDPARYELAWLVPLALGGAVDWGNAWPLPPDVARAKAAVDAAAVRSVCTGRATLNEAQYKLRHGWPGYGATLGVHVPRS